MESIVLDSGNSLSLAGVGAKEKEFSDCFLVTHDRVFRALLAVARDRTVAEDALGDAYLKAWQHWDQVRTLDNPTGWIVRVAINSSISHWRRLRRFVPLVGAARPAGQELTSDPDVLLAVAALPMRQRQVVALRLLIGFSTAETAGILGIAQGTVTAHLYTAVRAVRASLGDREEG
jgi:DNA-directed RNA polymerase specialized sigma24 family protein